MPFDPSSFNTSASSTQVPAIRTFQMDNSSQSNLSNSVNLFRGDVNLFQTLLTLPGRSQGDKLDVSVSVQYQSNVFREAVTWNVDAPTGVLGLGWEFPLTRIVANSFGSPVAGERAYTLYDNGLPNRLYRQSVLPVLFSMDGALSSSLQNGAALPPDIRNEFLKHGLWISTSAVVRGGGPWVVVDDSAQQNFTLQTSASGALDAVDGGELYQLQNYQFQKVLYYPDYERWVIISDQAVRRSFGGRTANTANGFATAEGNSVVWSVWWADADGKAVWTGPSNNTSGQTQVAQAWYLTEVSDRFGSKIKYAYNEFSRNADGIIPVVEQQVGNGGKPYTKAVYLTSIVDVYKRTVRFQYADKLWQEEGSSPREYHDPHRVIPSNDPGPFQDRYETRYLDSLAVNDPTGALMFSVDFVYDPRPKVSGVERAVANILENAGSRQGDAYKRFLTAIVQRNQDGVAAPGLQFTYDLTGNTAGGQPGALSTVTYPQGGVARYTYLKQELALCERMLEVDRPAAVPEGATPRVFYGNDYVVVCFYQPTSTQLSLQVFTWTGRWLTWQLNPDSALIDTQGLVLSSLQVLAEADYLALTFQRAVGDREVYAFQRDPARPGQWQPAIIEDTITSVDKPSLSYTASGDKVSFSGGQTFFVVSSMDSSQSKGSYDVLTWRWSTQSWDKTRTTIENYAWVAAANHWFVVLDRAGSLEIHYLDGLLAWQSAPPVTVEGLSTIDTDSIRIIAGVSMVVVANLQSSNSQQNTYALWLAKWGSDYQATVLPFRPYTDNFGAENPPMSWTPVIRNDTLVAVNGNLLRFDGNTWSENTLLNIKRPDANTTQRYAYGANYAIQVVTSTSGVGLATAQVMAFDPTQDPAWVGPTPISQTLPDQSTPDRNWPTASGEDWAAIGPFVYYRGTATDWGAVMRADVKLNMNEIISGTTPSGSLYNSESLVNAAPSFLSYTVSNGNDQSVQSISLRNGTIDGVPIQLTDQKLYTDSDGGVEGQGLSSQGPQLFTTYPSQYPSIDAAQRVLLHRFAGYAVKGPITHYTVVKVAMDDGFGSPISISFQPDSETASADVSGNIVKFFQNTTYPGTADVLKPHYGHVINRYLNGVADMTGDNYYDMLDGLLVATEIWAQDGTEPVESTTTRWQVVEQIGSSPIDPNAPMVQLRGGWVTKTQSVQIKNGVTMTTDISYIAPGLQLPYGGQPVSQSQSSYDGAGVKETFTQTTRYGVEYYPSMQAIHALADKAQTSTVRSSNRNNVALASNATTFSGWSSNLGPGVKSPASEAGFGLLETNEIDFPFRNYTPGSTPDGWQLKARTTHRAPYGQETGNVDALGAPTTTIFDSNDEIAVAHIANASPDECAYLGFQSYEDTRAWTLTGITYDDNDTYTGTRSAIIPGGQGASISVQVTTSRTDTWMVGCRYRTPSCFVPDASGLQVSVSIDAESPSVVSLPWAVTSAQWSYVTLPVPLASGQSITLQMTASNTTSTDVHVDAILVAPLLNGTMLRTFDPDSQQVLSTMDAGGRISRLYYDRSYRATASVGAGAQVQELSMSFMSRQGSASDSFEADSPNAELTLHAADGGTLESFRDGGLWATRWVPLDLSTWSVDNGALSNVGPGNASISWATAGAGSTYAIYFEVQPSEQSNITVTAGDISIGWRNNQWIASQAGSSWSPLASPPTIATGWLLVVGDEVVLFFGNGQLLFSEQTRPQGDALSINVSGALSTFRNLAALQNIRLGLSYNDATGRQRQVQQLYKEDSLICELVYDPLGRSVATTKKAPGRFGRGASVPTLQYRASFLDAAAFLTATQTTWVMTGDVAQYYNGDNGRPDDQGYPYWGVRFESSSRSVTVETSLPGKHYAIDLTIPASERQTIQYQHRANTGSEPDLPRGQYAETRIRSAVGTISSQVSNKLGQQVSTVFDNADGKLVNRSAGVRAYSASEAGPSASLSQQLPNALVDGPQSGNTSYIRTTIANALQELNAATDPDSGETQFIMDSVGNLRFVQPATDDDQQWFIYYRYDAIGRMTEEGTVKQPWDLQLLRQKADDRSYPNPNDADVNASIVTEYDGNGSEPTLVGMKWRATTNNIEPNLASGDGNCEVVEVFAYDRAGNMISVTQTLSGAATASGVVGYSYNALSEVTRVDLPEGARVASLYYSYDDQGHITSVGSSPGGSQYGSFTYTAEGQVLSQIMGPWTRLVTYNSPGWISQIATTSSDGAQHLNLAMDYDADGSMHSRSIESTFAGHAFNYADKFCYDDQRRVSAAVGDSDVQYTQYDPNGNLWMLNHKGKVSSFDCRPSSNRLQQVALDGGPEQALTYDAAGRMRAGLGRKLEYDTTSMTTVVSTASASIRLAYGSAQQRVLKKALGGGAQTIYFSGAGQVPVATLVDGKWGITVHGPTGLLAWVTDTTQFLITDITDSIWAVVSGAGELTSAQTYLPFGLTTVVYGQPEMVPYGFQSQEWDAEVGLYNFRTRMYDPALRRFLTPDPQRQFASGYVFGGNNPLIVTDPTGEISIWAQVGIGAALVAVTAVGIGLTLFTGGGSDVAATAADAALLGSAEVAEAGAAVAGEGAAVVGEGAAAAGEGAAAAAGGEGAAVSSFSLTTYGVNTLGATLSGAGKSGLIYDLQHGRDFTAKSFFEAIGIGAASGSVSGALRGALNPLVDSITAGGSGVTGALRTAAGRAVVGAIRGSLSSDVKTLLTNVAQHQPLYQSVLKSTLSGAATTAATSSAFSLGNSTWNNRGAIAAKAAAKGVISNQTAQTIATLPEIAQRAARNRAFRATTIVAGFFIPSGYVLL